MSIRTNKLKQKLAAGGLVLSGGVRLPEPGLVEVMGYAGVDYVLIDAGARLYGLDRDRADGSCCLRCGYHTDCSRPRER